MFWSHPFALKLYCWTTTCDVKALQPLCFLWGLHSFQWQLIWGVHSVVIGLRVILLRLVPCKIHKDLEYKPGKKVLEGKCKVKKTHTQNIHSSKELVDISLPILFLTLPPPFASKTNRNSGTDNRVHVNELPDKGYEASSKRLSSHSECQFDIFDQLRKRIKQSFFSLWCPFYVRRNQSYGVHKKSVCISLCCKHHCSPRFLFS